MSEQEITFREQADAVKLVGMNEQGWLENIRASPKQPQWKGDTIEDRQPKLRAAWKTLDELAKGQGQ